MKSITNSITSSHYIQSFAFDQVETYSLQRGEEYNAVIQMLKPERNGLKVRKEKRNNLTETEEIRLSELDKLLGVTQYLIDDTGQFHFSSQRINTFQYGNEVVGLLKNILLTKTTDVSNWIQQRQNEKYIDLAKTYKYKIIGYYFSSSLRSSLERNSARINKERIPDIGIRGTHKKLQIPSLDEGFEKLYYVSLDTRGFTVKDWKNEV